MARKILIVQTAFLGDLLLSIPLIKRAKSLYPDYEIEILCREGFGSFFTYQKLVTCVHEIKKNDKESYRAISNTLKNQEYELCLCPHQSLRSAFFVSCINAKQKIAFESWWNRIFYTTRVPRPLKLPDALRQLSLLKYEDLSLEDELNNYQQNQMISAELSMQVEIQPIAFRSPIVSQLSEKNFVLLAPGSQWPTKRWTPEGFGAVANQLKTEKREVALVGNGREDATVNRLILELAPGVVDLTDLTDLNELAWLMTKSQALICNDSGLMHLASVAGLPTVAIFGPTTRDLGYIPWQNNGHIIEKELFCRPCGKHGHKRCPLNTHECMKAISSSMVLDVFKKVDKGPDQRERR